MTDLSVIAALITVGCCIATAFVATLPKDALTVRVVEHAECRFNKASFDTLWSILGGGFSYRGVDCKSSYVRLSNGYSKEVIRNCSK